MKIILSAAISLDGCLDDCSPERLKLSSPEDWAQVQALRGRCDAILVGAGTVRKDNPSLVIRDEAARRARLRAGMDEDILKVTVTSGGALDPDSDFFTQGASRKIVFAPFSADDAVLSRLDAEVVRAEKITAKVIVNELALRGVRTLMVEGGSAIHTMFLAEGMADELRLAVAPFFVGDRNAPRLMNDGRFAWNKDNRMTLDSVEMLGDTTVMHLRGGRSEFTDAEYLQAAIDESRRCVPVMTAYCVGVVIVTRDGSVFKGYTHETDPSNHAEEEAVLKAEVAGANLCGAVIYSSMEPCSTRKSKPRSCSQLIVEKGFAKVVYALAEPPHFVECHGRDLLRQAGVEVVEMPQLGRQVEEINKHIE